MQDILSSNDKSFVLNEFSSFLDDEIISQITTVFSSKPKTNDDINISVDQIEILTTAIAKGLKYPDFSPDGKFDYNTMLQFLEKLCGIFKWEIYEKFTLGYRTQQSQRLGKLRWYTVIVG